MKIYRYKLYTNAKRGELGELIYRFGSVRNYVIRLMSCYYRIYHKNLTAYDVINHIVRKKKNGKCATGKLVVGLDAQAVQECVGRVYKGYRNFFAYCNRKTKKSCNRVRPPSVRNPHYNKSFTLLQCGYKILTCERNKIKILGKVYGFFKSQELKGKVKRVTIKKDCCGDLWIIVLTDYVDSKLFHMTGNAAGFDFGLKTFLTRHDGKQIESPEFLKRDFEKYRHLSRLLSKKNRGSKNRRKAKLVLSRFHRHIENSRCDWQWKTARSILNEFDVVCFENLNLDGMKRLWGRKVSDYSFSSFLNKIEYLANSGGKEVRFVPWNFASSQICSNCGYKNTITKDLSIREWVCPSCGIIHNRDTNAAKNILMVGTSTDWRGSVRPDSKKIMA